MKYVLYAALALLALPAAAQSQNAADSTSPRPFSWTADRRQFVAGDVVTILIDELTIASADKSNSDSQDRITRGSLSTGMRTGAGGTSVDVGVQSGFGGETKNRGQAKRQDRIAAEISARITKIEPNGALRVEGKRAIKIDGHEQALTITGLVRPQDLSYENVVDSWRLSDLQLAYASSPALGKPKAGILGKIVGIIWP
jgi:flagellar L-ring protein FlgH